MRVSLSRLRQLIREGVAASPRTSDDVSTFADLEAFAEPLVGDDLYTHAVRSDDAVASVLRSGIMPGHNGFVSSTRTTDAGHGGQIDDHGVRSTGSGYVVFRGADMEPYDVVDADQRYPEWRTRSTIPASAVVKVVRMVTDRTGHRVREDHLAQYAVGCHGRPTPPDVADLPEKYRAWFSL